LPRVGCSNRFFLGIPHHKKNFSQTEDEQETEQKVGKPNNGALA
jgi:hypothetical protein